MTNKERAMILLEEAEVEKSLGKVCAAEARLRCDRDNLTGDIDPLTEERILRLKQNINREQHFGSQEN